MENEIAGIRSFWAARFVCSVLLVSYRMFRHLRNELAALPGCRSTCTGILEQTVTAAAAFCCAAFDLCPSISIARTYMQTVQTLSAFLSDFSHVFAIEPYQRVSPWSQKSLETVWELLGITKRSEKNESRGIESSHSNQQRYSLGFLVPGALYRVERARNFLPSLSRVSHTLRYVQETRIVTCHGYVYLYIFILREKSGVLAWGAWLVMPSGESTPLPKTDCTVRRTDRRKYSVCGYVHRLLFLLDYPRGCTQTETQTKTAGVIRETVSRTPTLE